MRFYILNFNSYINYQTSRIILFGNDSSHIVENPRHNIKWIVSSPPFEPIKQLKVKRRYEI